MFCFKLDPNLEVTRVWAHCLIYCTWLPIIHWPNFVLTPRSITFYKKMLSPIKPNQYRLNAYCPHFGAFLSTGTVAVYTAMHGYIDDLASLLYIFTFIIRRIAPDYLFALLLHDDKKKATPNKSYRATVIRSLINNLRMRSLFPRPWNTDFNQLFCFVSNRTSFWPCPRLPSSIREWLLIKAAATGGRHCTLCHRTILQTFLSMSLNMLRSAQFESVLYTNTERISRREAIPINSCPPLEMRLVVLTWVLTKPTVCRPVSAF